MAVLAIDWDNTLFAEKEWLPGAKDAIRLFREKGHKVLIHSCNASDWIIRQIDEAGLVVDHVCGKDQGKPLADLYIDDKGYHFPYNGKWTEAEVAAVLNRVDGKDNRKW